MLIIASTLNAQILQELAFAETTHEFGTVNEVDGPVEFSFKFTNTGQSPIKIMDVKASCGCTTPDWTKTAVEPGGAGFVQARYNPLNRPGPFNKSLTITTDGNTKRYVVYIKGNVNPKPRTIEDDFPTLMGGLRVKYRGFNLGKVLNNEPVSKTFEVYNASEEPITFLDSLTGPDYVKVEVVPQTLQSEEKGTIVVTYDVPARKDLGHMADNIVLYTDEADLKAIKSFSLYINVEEYFEPMNAEELALAPKLKITEPVHDFGKVNQGDILTADLSISNEGKSTLNLRKLASSCSCVTTKMESMDIEPGKEAIISVSFNTTGRRGTQQKNITIFTNDPKAPTQRIIVKASVQTK